MLNPYGGELVNLIPDQKRLDEIKRTSISLHSVTLSRRQLCDLELLMCGAFSPLAGFMTRQDYMPVVENMRLANGMLWSLPVTLDISSELAGKLVTGDMLGLLDEEGFMLAVLHIEDLWQVDRGFEAVHVFGTQDTTHPSIKYLTQDVGEYYVGGLVEGMQLPIHYDFESLRDTPEELRNRFQKKGWKKIIGFCTGKPIHKAHYDLTLDVAEQVAANILLHPLVGLGKPGELEYFSRVRCYQKIMSHYPHHMIMLSLLPYATRMAGPRESIHSAIVRQNYGCSHFIIGPEHGSPPETRQGGIRFYDRYSAQHLVDQYQDELEIKIIPVEERCYSNTSKRFEPLSEFEKCENEYIVYSDEDLYNDLRLGNNIPDWFSFPDVIDELKKVFRPRATTGVTLFFTGLSGSGKSTLAQLIYAKFIESGTRPVTLLDGDVVRHHLSSELGFSKEHRDINVKRIGFVASEINKNGGVAICAPIAPYASVREYVRNLNSKYGAFIEIHVSTPLEMCEMRDRKGLYARARKGEIKQFTGISDPYEAPENPEIRIDTSNMSPLEAAQDILLYLTKEGYINE